MHFDWENAFQDKNYQCLFSALYIPEYRKLCSLMFRTSLCSEHVCVLNHVWLFATLWTVARQAPLCMGLFMEEYWSGLPLPSPGDLPSPSTEPVSSISCTWRQILYLLNHQVSPRILKWVPYPFSRGSSWPRIQTGSPALQRDSLPAELK